MTQPSERFLAQLAHDLRSPLNVIGSSLLELSQDSGLPQGDRDQVITLAQRGVARLLVLSDRLALAARLAHPIEVKPQAQDLVAFTRRVVDAFVPAQLRKRLEVVSLFPPAPAPIQAEVALLEVLLLELLTNANRFARKVLRVEIAVGPTLVLTVDDDGEGILPDERPMLFEPFAERRSRTGLGMGLWLARRLAELHHGTLTAEHLDPGTRLRLVLPLSP